MGELSLIVRELVRIVTGYYPPGDEPLDETLQFLQTFVGPALWHPGSQIDLLHERDGEDE